MKRLILLGFFLFVTFNVIIAQDFTIDGLNGEEYERINENEKKFLSNISNVTIHYYKNEKQVQIIEDDIIRNFSIEDEVWDSGLIDYMILIENSDTHEEVQLDFDGSLILLYENLDYETLSFKVIKIWQEE